MKSKLLVVLLLLLSLVALPMLYACETTTHEHTFTTYVSDNNATCEEDGTKTAKCESCNITNTVADEGTALGHKYESGVCSVCGKNESGGSEKPPLEGCEHSWASSRLEPTCTKDGKITYICLNCMGTYSDTLPATGHSYMDGACKDCGAPEGTTPPPVENCEHKRTTTEKQDATCEVDGIEKIICSDCKTLISENILPATGHGYAEEWSADADGHWHAVTCGCNISVEKEAHTFTTADGMALRACAVCGYTPEEVTPPACEHKRTTAEKQDATCEVDGFEKIICSDCKTIISENILPATGHGYADEWSADDDGHWHAVTCGCNITVEKEAHIFTTADGMALRACAVCGYTPEEVTPPACEHKRTTAEKQDATCEADGFEKIICSDCKTLISENILPATGHGYADEWSTDADGHWHAVTCGCNITVEKEAHIFTTADGMALRACAVCGYTPEEVTPPACEHKRTTAEKQDATCEADGFEKIICAECKAVISENILPATGHGYADEWSTDADGHWHAVTCGCNITVEKEAHSFSEEDPYTCSVCGYTAEVTEPEKSLQYTYKSKTLELKLYSDGTLEYTEYKTTDNGEIMKIDGTGQWFADEASKTVNAYVGDAIMLFRDNGDGTLSPKEADCEHEYSDNIEAPTCTEDGFNLRTCGKCGNVQTIILPATGHNYKNADGSASEKCNVCGEPNPDYAPAECEHEFTESSYIIISEPTCTEDGEYVGVCYKCKVEIKGVIPAAGHSDNDGDGVCDNCGKGEETPTDPSDGLSDTYNEMIAYFEALIAEKGGRISHAPSDVLASAPEGCKLLGICAVSLNDASYSAQLYQVADKKSWDALYASMLPNLDSTAMLVRDLGENVYILEYKASSEDCEHEFEEGWSFDADGHWHAVICGCNITVEKEAHTFTTADGMALRACAVCGYTPEEVTPPAGECEHSYKIPDGCIKDCTAGATVAVVCELCGKIVAVDIAPTEHIYSNDFGERFDYCLVCNTPIKSEDTSISDTYNAVIAELEARAAAENGIKEELTQEELSMLPEGCAVIAAYKFSFNNGRYITQIFQCADEESYLVLTEAILAYMSDSAQLQWNINEPGENVIVLDYVTASEGGCEHDIYVAEEFSPTCTEDGYILMLCNNCFEYESREILPAAGHIDTDGDGACDACGKTDDAPPATECKHEKRLVENQEASCETDGYKRVVCAECKKIISENIFHASGHVFDETVGTCVNCGAESSEILPPTDDKERPEYIPEGAVKIGNSYYLIVIQDGMTRKEARLACEAMNGQLASITSAEEQKAIEALNKNGASLWIGGYRDDDGAWKWLSGESWNYTNWGEGEPNNSSNVVSNERYVTLWPYFWNDLANNNIYEQNGYICEWNLDLPVSTPSVDTDEDIYDTPQEGELPGETEDGSTDTTTPEEKLPDDLTEDKVTDVSPDYELTEEEKAESEADAAAKAEEEAANAADAAA